MLTKIAIWHYCQNYLHNFAFFALKSILFSRQFYKYFFCLDESTFEDAITATGFGKYNYVLLFIISVPCIAQLVNTVELSYVLPVAACDLDLSLEDKGVLNAVMFAGK